MFRGMKALCLISILMVCLSQAWGQQNEDQKLLASDGAADDGFGRSVSVSGDIALVGAYQNDGSGSAYVFHYDSGTGTWIEEDKLLPSDGATGDYFGWCVSVSGNVAIVGAFRDDDNGTDSGSACVFRYDSGTGTWVEEDKLLPSDGAADDHFGWSVSVSGNVAVVGAETDDDNGTDSGSAYVFRYDSGTGTWIEEDKLLASDGAAGDYFGYSVPFSGDVAVVGAVLDDDNGTDSGSAYVFRYDSGTGTWIEEDKLLASDGAAGDYFGYSISFSDDVAVVGACFDDDNGTDSGSAYVFRYDSGSGAWTEEAMLLASDGAADDLFGISVSVSGDLAVVGAQGDDDNGNDSGSTYVFNISPYPVIDVKANGQDGPITVNSGETVTVTIDLDSREYAGFPVDVWVVAMENSGAGYWSYDSANWWLGWAAEYFTGPLYNISDTVINGPLPIGSFTLFFGIELNPNGNLNVPYIWGYDSVTVTVQHAPAEMAFIPAGEFEMGDHYGVGQSNELPVHAVYIDAFWMDISEPRTYAEVCLG